MEHFIQEFVDHIRVVRKERLDNAILGEIKSIVNDNEIHTTVELNEKAIVEAFRKRTPMKPIPHKVELDGIKIRNVRWGKCTKVYVCPSCGGFISITNKCCHECGQAIDWGKGGDKNADGNERV